MVVLLTTIIGPRANYLRIIPEPYQDLTHRKKYRPWISQPLFSVQYVRSLINNAQIYKLILQNILLSQVLN